MMLYKYAAQLIQDLEANDYRRTSKFHVTLHRMMWAWLAAHPRVTKQSFAFKLCLPTIARTVFFNNGNCFACLYAMKNCDNCPLQWNNKYSTCTNVYDPHSADDVDRGVYMYWIDRHPRNPFRKDYALSIALRPVKPGIPCI